MAHIEVQSGLRFCCFFIATIISVERAGTVLAQGQQAAAVPGAEPLAEVRREAGGVPGFGATPLAERPTSDPGRITQESPGAVTTPGSAATAYNAPDISELLSRSSQDTSVQLQFRNGVFGDLPVRGLHVGHLITICSGGDFLPNRQDIYSATESIDTV